MATATASWPCPACAELLPSQMDACPHCQLPGPWVDLLLAQGFAVRQFHFWHVCGAIDKPQFKALVKASREEQDAMLQAAQAGYEAPADTGLPSPSACWNCQYPTFPAAKRCPSCRVSVTGAEVRLIRYQTYLSRQVRDHAKAGRLATEAAETFLDELEKSLAELQARTR